VAGRYGTAAATLGDQQEEHVLLPRTLRGGPDGHLRQLVPRHRLLGAVGQLPAHAVVVDGDAGLSRVR
jgi:hypothetical protein